MNFSLNPIYFLLPLLLIGFTPYLGVIDTIGSQWLFLSLLNLFFFAINLFNYNFFSFINSFSKLPLFRLYIAFIFFVILSLFFTNNIRISIVDFSRILIVFFSIINFTFLFYKAKYSLLFFAKCVSLILFFEVIFAFKPLILYLFENKPISDIDFSQLSFALKGFTGNKNVMASYVAFKLPFVFYVIFKSNGYLRFFSSVIFFLSISLIYFCAARTAYISTFLVLSILFLYLLFYKFQDFLKSFIYFFIPIISLYFLISSVNNIIQTYSDSDSKLNSITIIDESSNNRLILYENAFDYISKHPFIGCGIGNWKIESLPYWKDIQSGYVVPYHAHNDFLELATEIGLIGSLFYLAIFLFVFYYCIRYFLINKDFYSILFFCMCLVYFFDAMLNFPLERTISQLNFILLFSLLSIKMLSNEKFSS